MAADRECEVGREKKHAGARYCSAGNDCVPLASSERFHAALVEHKIQAQLHVIKNGHHNA